MQIEHFKTASQRLTKEFSYSEEKLWLIWQKVKSLTNDEFEILIDHCIGEFKPNFPPKLSEINQFVQEQKRLRFIEGSRRIIAESPVGTRWETNALDQQLKEAGVTSIQEWVKKQGGNL